MTVVLPGKFISSTCTILVAQVARGVDAWMVVIIFRGSWTRQLLAQLFGQQSKGAGKGLSLPMCVTVAMQQGLCKETRMKLSLASPSPCSRSRSVPSLPAGTAIIKKIATNQINKMKIHALGVS